MSFRNSSFYEFFLNEVVDRIYIHPDGIWTVDVVKNTHSNDFWQLKTFTAGAAHHLSGQMDLTWT